MKTKILNDRKVDPFAIIRSLPDQPLFKDCPVRPSDKTIEAAEDFYLRFAEPPSYVSSNDEKVILEWYWPTIKNPKMIKELIFKDAINLEWRTYDY
jgi:hypothetical protein